MSFFSKKSFFAIFNPPKWLICINYHYKPYITWYTLLRKIEPPRDLSEFWKLSFFRKKTFFSILNHQKWIICINYPYKPYVTWCTLLPKFGPPRDLSEFWKLSFFRKKSYFAISNPQKWLIWIKYSYKPYVAWYTLLQIFGPKMLSKLRKCETFEIHCDLGFQDFFDLTKVLDRRSYRENIIFYFPLYFFENVFPKVSTRLFLKKGLF